VRKRSRTAAGQGRTSEVAALIGHPVSHSLSPAIFSFLSRRFSRKIQYDALDISPGELKRALGLLRSLDFIGCNITIPYKEKVIACLDRVSDETRVIGAANVVYNKDGELIGYNSDVLGILETLREARVRISGREVVLYGAGGAARAVAYAMGVLGAKDVWITNRTPHRARALTKKFGSYFSKTRYHVLAWESFPLGRQIDLWVNATPLGMAGFPRSRTFSFIPGKNAFALDLIYRPEETPFLKKASAEGLKTIGGLDMLVWQAIGTWELWFGKMSGKHETKVALKKFLKQRLRRIDRCT